MTEDSQRYLYTEKTLSAPLTLDGIKKYERFIEMATIFYG